MYDCCDCYCVSYCSEQHHEEDKERHTDSCRQLRIAMLADVYEVEKFIIELIIPLTSVVDPHQHDADPHRE